ncbi:MAG: CDP-diacylglycerol--serine O-phosphatidyltransferase [Planctomycetota bacterium]|nr:MAG: CDP-diacylglycerol--serine O-phosphatidyltransferase [Planctomycetota bacterium]
MTRHRKNVRARILRSTAVLPAAFTLLNGLAGFAAIHFAAKDGLGAELDAGNLAHLKIAAGLIFAAMFCDMLDGRLARMTRTTSDFGAQLDSLCDIISFGVAPAVLSLRSAVSILRSQFDMYLPVERTVWCIAAVYVACATLRLARFNVETEQDEAAHMDFRGLPTPAAAAGLAAVLLMFTSLMGRNLTWLSDENLMLGMSVTLPVLTLVSGLLMVSRFRYPHVMNQYIRGRRPFGYLLKLLLLFLAAVTVGPYIVLAGAVLFYILSGPARTTWLLIRKRRD